MPLTSPRPTARASGAPRRGRCAPPTPRAAPPVRPSAHGPLPLVAQRGGAGARWVVPTEPQAIGGNTRQARIACEIPLPLTPFLMSFGKRSASGRSRCAVGKGGGRGGDVVKPGVLQDCPHVHSDPPFVHLPEQARSCHKHGHDAKRMPGGTNAPPPWGGWSLDSDVRFLAIEDS